MVDDARARRVAARRQEILEAARAGAEAGGWASVTTRTLADAIGYSQPVLYGHFPGGKPEIMSEVALKGFRELAAAMGRAVEASPGKGAALTVAQAYLDFAAANPAVYSAMFTLPIAATFAQDNSEPELKAGFTAIVSVVGNTGEDAETVAEVFWSALHGISELERAGRMRPEHRSLRLKELVSRFAGSTDEQV